MGGTEPSSSVPLFYHISKPQLSIKYQVHDTSGNLGAATPVKYGCDSMDFTHNFPISSSSIT